NVRSQLASLYVPYTTIFRSVNDVRTQPGRIAAQDFLLHTRLDQSAQPALEVTRTTQNEAHRDFDAGMDCADGALQLDKRLQILRSEEHTSELQSRENLVCRL